MTIEEEISAETAVSEVMTRNVVTISFPLYYMERGQAQQFIETVLTQKFSEPTHISNETEVVIEYSLFHFPLIFFGSISLIFLFKSIHAL